MGKVKLLSCRGPQVTLLVLELDDTGLIDLDRPIHEYMDTDNAYGPDFFENDSHRRITAPIPF